MKIKDFAVNQIIFIECAVDGTLKTLKSKVLSVANNYLEVCVIDLSFYGNIIFITEEMLSCVKSFEDPYKILLESSNKNAALLRKFIDHVFNTMYAERSSSLESVAFKLMRDYSDVNKTLAEIDDETIEKLKNVV